MRKRVTLKDVAKLVGVHVSTVSRALDPTTSSRISPDVTERVRAACKKLNYRQNAAAYSLKTNRTRTVGVIVPDITDPAIPPIIRGIEDALSRHQYVAILANTDGDGRRESRIAEMMRSRGVDGLILASVRRRDAIAEQLTREGTPFVTVNRRIEDTKVSSVVHDEQDGIRRSVTHLVSLGHRRIAAIAGPQALSTGYTRYRALERQRTALNVTGGPVIFANEFTEAEGDRCTEELLSKGVPFTAVICANDRIAVGAIAALRRRGMLVPDDVSVTGFNDMPLADRLHPPLTTVRVQHYKGGVEAAEMLVEMIERPDAAREARHVVLPVEFVVRASTRAVAADAPAGRIARPRREAARA
jgi:LacI family transcriptional regulator